jgi:hypothetical protein
MKFRLGYFAALLTVALAPGVQADDDWKTYRYPQDGFAADFPTPPVLTDQELDPQRGTREMAYWSDLGDIAFGVHAAHFHHEVIASQPPDKQIQTVVDGVRSGLNCAVSSQRVIALPGATGREVTFDKCPAEHAGGAKQRIFIVGDRLFQMLVLGSTPGLAESADTKRFLESFSLMAQ